MMDFQEFPKIARLSRECIITEKIDGTNAQIYIEEFPSTELRSFKDMPIIALLLGQEKHMAIFAGSRSRWITPKDDNYGFAKYVEQNAEELSLLGPGRHFGEWWGDGIQRKYNLKEKRFSLFNVSRWSQESIPACCHVVPELYRGIFSTEVVDNILENLKINGSYAASGFMRPEGVVIYHTAAKIGFKKTIEKDDEPKGKGVKSDVTI